MKFQTISELEVIKLAQQAKSDEVNAIWLAINAIKEKGIEPSEAVVQSYNVATEQFDELTDCIETIERSARRGGIGDMTRLKVEPKYGDWYYQKIKTEEDGDIVHTYALYEGEDYVGEFGNITAMKHYARTGQRW